MTGQATTAQPTADQPGQPQCQHHWLIEPPSGPLSRGVCKHCAEERYFMNAPPEWTGEERHAAEAPETASDETLPIRQTGLTLGRRPAKR